jgi:hypothetical protein
MDVHKRPHNVADDLSTSPFIDPRLLDACEVEVELHGHIIDRGIVDGVTVDGSMLWLKQDGITPGVWYTKLPGMYIRGTASTIDRAGL